MIETSQMPVTNSVRRSRFFSTTVDPDRLDWTPPPNRVDRPPPLARCSRTRSTTSTLVTIRMICRANSMAARLQAVWPGLGQRPTSGDSRKRGELLAVQRRPSDQRAVHILLRDDLADVLGVDRAAVEHPDACRQLRGRQLAELVADGLADLLCVARAGHPAGADRPHRLVGDHGVADLFCGQPGKGAAPHLHVVFDVVSPPPPT